jgi:hypothetical protein
MCISSSEREVKRSSHSGHWRTSVMRHSPLWPAPMDSFSSFRSVGEKGHSGAYGHPKRPTAGPFGLCAEMTRENSPETRGIGRESQRLKG